MQAAIFRSVDLRNHPKTDFLLFVIEFRAYRGIRRRFWSILTESKDCLAPIRSK